MHQVLWNGQLLILREPLQSNTPDFRLWREDPPASKSYYLYLHYPKSSHQKLHKSFHGAFNLQRSMHIALLLSILQSVSTNYVLIVIQIGFRYTRYIQQLV
jgi:hypothetical protein